jgi:hypothetical protein
VFLNKRQSAFGHQKADNSSNYPNKLSQAVIYKILSRLQFTARLTASGVAFSINSKHGIKLDLAIKSPC